jgi:hypothetical protein
MSAPKGSHSAVVMLTLAISDREIALFEAAHDFAILSDSVELTPCDAELLTRIDRSGPRFCSSSCRKLVQ